MAKLSFTTIISALKTFRSHCSENYEAKSAVETLSSVEIFFGLYLPIFQFFPLTENFRSLVKSLSIAFLALVLLKLQQSNC